MARNFQRGQRSRDGRRGGGRLGLVGRRRAVARRGLPDESQLAAEPRRGGAGSEDMRRAGTEHMRFAGGRQRRFARLRVVTLEN